MLHLSRCYLSPWALILPLASVLRRSSAFILPAMAVYNYSHVYQGQDGGFNCGYRYETSLPSVDFGAGFSNDFGIVDIVDVDFDSFNSFNSLESPASLDSDTFDEVCIKRRRHQPTTRTDPRRRRTSETRLTAPPRRHLTSASRRQHALDRPSPARPAPDRPAPGVLASNILWPRERRHLRVQFLNGDAYDRRIVNQLVTEHYNSIPMRLRFQFLQPSDPSPSDIRVAFSDRSESYVGRNAAKHPGQPTMWIDMCRGGGMPASERRSKRRYNVLHEFGHALGMQHEHQHPECKANWNYRVLQQRMGWSAEAVRDNFGRLAQGVKLAEYDPESIMHYPVDQGDTMSMVMYVPQATGLSDGDRRFLMAVYPLKPTGAVAPREKSRRHAPVIYEEPPCLEQRVTPETVTQAWVVASQEVQPQQMMYSFGALQVDHVDLTPCYYCY